MKTILLFVSLLLSVNLFAQCENISGKFSHRENGVKLQLDQESCEIMHVIFSTFTQKVVETLNLDLIERLKGRNSDGDLMVTGSWISKNEFLVEYVTRRPDFSRTNYHTKSYTVHEDYVHIVTIQYNDDSTIKASYSEKWIRD